LEREEYHLDNHQLVLQHRQLQKELMVETLNLMEHEQVVVD
tara:strand:- start:454 stop:576 length:123 start_codon:yes stop_codon:yes gene_type:complete